jgi:hypothetical protein
MEWKNRVKKDTSEERLVHRRKSIIPSFAAFNDWVETQQKNVLSKIAKVKALLYAVNQLP